MAKLAFTLTALFTFFAFTGGARASEPVLQTFRIDDPTPGTLEFLTQFYDVEHKVGPNSFEFAVPASEAKVVQAFAPQARLVDADISATISKTLAEYEQTAQLTATNFEAPRYHSFDEVQAWMKNMQMNHADIARVIEYGKSRNGKALTALRISAFPEDSADVPVAMITAATHGDELITTEVLMGLVNQLVEGNGTIDRMSKIVQSRVIYFIPVVNADGFVSRNRYDGNADPNRSYPWPEKTNAVATPSIAALIDFFNTKKVTVSLDLHAYGELTMFPWGYTRNHLPSGPHERMDLLTTKMSELNRYTHGPIAETIYVAQGSSADYYYWKQGTLGLAVEIGSSKVPSPGQIPSLIQSQEESTWRMLEGI